MKWCSHCNRWTDNTCEACEIMKQSDKDKLYCVEENCEKCKLYMEKEDLCGLVFMPKEEKDGNQ